MSTILKTAGKHSALCCFRALRHPSRIQSELENLKDSEQNKNCSRLIKNKLKWEAQEDQQSLCVVGKDRIKKVK